MLQQKSRTRPPERHWIVFLASDLSRWVNTDSASGLVFEVSQRSAEPTWTKVYHDDVIKWKHFPRYWPFVRGIHRSPVNSTHKGQWRGALILSLICVWTNAWVNNRDAGDLRRYRAHYDVIVMMVYYFVTRGEWENKRLECHCMETHVPSSL